MRALFVDIGSALHGLVLAGDVHGGVRMSGSGHGLVRSFEHHFAVALRLQGIGADMQKREGESHRQETDGAGARCSEGRHAATYGAICTTLGPAALAQLITERTGPEIHT